MRKMRLNRLRDFPKSVLELSMKPNSLTLIEYILKNDITLLYDLTKMELIMLPFPHHLEVAGYSRKKIECGVRRTCLCCSAIHRTL